MLSAGLCCWYVVQNIKEGVQTRNRKDPRDLRCNTSQLQFFTFCLAALVEHDEAI